MLTNFLNFRLLSNSDLLKQLQSATGNNSNQDPGNDLPKDTGMDHQNDYNRRGGGGRGPQSPRGPPPKDDMMNQQRLHDEQERFNREMQQSNNKQQSNNFWQNVNDGPPEPPQNQSQVS